MCLLVLQLLELKLAAYLMDLLVLAMDVPIVCMVHASATMLTEMWEGTSLFHLIMDCVQSWSGLSAEGAWTTWYTST